MVTIQKTSTQACSYPRLSDEQYAKLKFHTRTQVTSILGPLKMYGQQPYVSTAIEALMLIIEETWDVIRGEDKPIDIEIIRRRKRNR